MTGGTTRVDRISARIKKNPLIAAAALIGTVIIALATFTDAARKLMALIPVPQSPHAARVELARMSINFEPQALCRSAKEGDVTVLNLLLAAGMNPDTSTDDDYRTPMVYAAVAGHANIVTALIHAGADVNKRIGNDATALSFATSAGHLDVVRTLLDAGSDADAINGAFVKAVLAKQRDAIRLLVERGADVAHRGAAALTELADSGGGDDALNPIAQLLLDLGADPNGRNEEDMTPLMMVARYGQIAVAQTLLAHGADVNARCTCTRWIEGGGMTPLFMAIYGGEPGMTKLLLDNGADVTARSNSGSTALGLAKNRYPEYIALLKNAGAK